MIFEKRLFSVAACAITLLGLSAPAMAHITASGCVLSGATYQTAPGSVSAFTTACPANTTGTYTFTLPDNINMVDDGTNTGAGMVAAGGGTLTGGSGSGTTASTGSSGCSGGCASTWWDIQYTLGVNVNQQISITHDDGIVFIVGSTVESNADAGPTSAETTTFTMTGTAGQVVNLLYDECCGLPAQLTVNLPGEVPEPASILLLGTLVTGVMTLLRRRVKG